MSYYSDWKWGGLSDDQYANACDMEEKKSLDKMEREMAETDRYLRLRDELEKALGNLGLELTDVEIDGTTVSIICEGYEDE